MERVGTVLKGLQTGHSSELILTSPTHEHFSENLLAALMTLAEARQTGLSKETMRTYLAPLAKFDFRDVQSALTRLAVAPDSTYSTAFPRLGTVVDAVRAAYEERTRPAPWVSCGACAPSGMVRVFRRYAGGPVCKEGEHTWTGMGECQCKRDWRAQRDALKGVREHAA